MFLFLSIRFFFSLTVFNLFFEMCLCVCVKSKSDVRSRKVSFLCEKHRVIFGERNLPTLGKVERRCLALFGTKMVLSVLEKIEKFSNRI